MTFNPCPECGEPVCSDCGQHHPGQVGAEPAGKSKDHALQPISPSHQGGRRGGYFPSQNDPVEGCSQGWYFDPKIGSCVPNMGRTSGPCPDSGQDHGQVAGPSCSPSPVTPHPTAYYQVNNLQMPAGVSIAFNRYQNGQPDYQSLMGANVGEFASGFSRNSYGACVMNGWKDGILIRVPASWLNVLNVKTLKAYPYLRNADGTQWQPSAGVHSPVSIADVLSWRRR